MNGIHSLSGMSTMEKNCQMPFMHGANTRRPIEKPIEKSTDVQDKIKEKLQDSIVGTKLDTYV